MKKLYAERDIQELGDYYSAHVSAMTGEGLHSKSDIAAELAWRDQEIDALQRQVDILTKANTELNDKLFTCGNDPLYVCVDRQNIFVEIENKDGKSVKIDCIDDDDRSMIGPLFKKLGPKDMLEHGYIVVHKTLIPEKVAQAGERVINSFQTEVAHDLACAVFTEMLAKYNGEELPVENVEDSTLQARVKPWLVECFGNDIAYDKQERNERFLEKAIELVQSLGMRQHEAHNLVSYVFGRNGGDPVQEVGGVEITLAALCIANGINKYRAAEKELKRIWTKIPLIREKQFHKPRLSSHRENKNYPDRTDRTKGF